MKYKITVASVLAGRSIPISIDPPEAGLMKPGKYIAIPVEEWEAIVILLQTLYTAIKP